MNKLDVCVWLQRRARFDYDYESWGGHVCRASAKNCYAADRIIRGVERSPIVFDRVYLAITKAYLVAMRMRAPVSHHWSAVLTELEHVLIKGGVS